MEVIAISKQGKLYKDVEGEKKKSKAESLNNSKHDSDY